MTAPVLAVPAAVAALRNAIRDALPTPDDDPDAGVEVFDGPDPTRAFAPRAVTVAAAFEDDQNAVTVDRETSGARPAYTDTITVACSVYSGSGEVDVEGHRETVGRILAAIDDALRADPTLGGVVSRAGLGSAQWLQGRDEAGVGVMAGFVVELTVLW